MNEFQKTLLRIASCPGDVGELCAKCTRPRLINPGHHPVVFATVPGEWIRASPDQEYVFICKHFQYSEPDLQIVDAEIVE